MIGSTWDYQHFQIFSQDIPTKTVNLREKALLVDYSNDILSRYHSKLIREQN